MIEGLQPSGRGYPSERQERGNGQAGVKVETFFAVGAILTAVAPSLELFVACRILVGFCLGVASMMTPVYITEISPPAKRGVLVIFSKLALTSAVPIAYRVDLAFAHARTRRAPSGVMLPGR